MAFRQISFPSAGPLAIAAVAVFLAILQWQMYARRSRYGWNLWGALLSLGTAGYATATFFQYNVSTAALFRLTSQVQMTTLALIIFSLVQYSVSYLRLRPRWSIPTGAAVFGAFILLVWSSDLVVDHSVTTVHFLLLGAPYNQAGLGPLGPVFLGLLGVVGTGEYGFLGFCAAVLTVTLRDYVALFDLAESRQHGLEQAKSEAERANLAAKFTPDGGRIELAARSVQTGSGSCLEVSVGDSGIGIDTADQERIFRPFEQAGDAAAHPRSGTGLGLSISRELIQRPRRVRRRRRDTGMTARR